MGPDTTEDLDELFGNVKPLTEQFSAPKPYDIKSLEISEIHDAILAEDIVGVEPTKPTQTQPCP